QLDQLHVDLGDLGDVFVDELDVDQRLLLQHVEHLQPAPAAVSTQRVTGVGDVLELSEHEVRNQHLVPQKTGLRDVHDPAVDDDAGVEKNAGVDFVGRERTRRASRPQYYRHHLVPPVEAQGHAPVPENESHDQRDDKAEVPG